MPVGLVTGFTQTASKPGLLVTINGGTAVISGSVASFPVGDISITANATNYIYLNFTSGLIETSTSGFLAGAWPICIAITNRTDVSTITDMRPDVFGSTAASTFPITGGSPADVGISRLGPASLALGNGTAADTTGMLSLATLRLGNGSSGTPAYSFINGTTSGLVFVANNASNLIFYVGSFDAFAVNAANGPCLRNDVPLMWISTNSLATPGLVVDTSIGRLSAGLLGVGTSNTTGFGGSLKLAALIATAVAPTVAAAQIGYGSTTAATASAGAGGALPATVEGYIIVNVAGTARKIPYYAT